MENNREAIYDLLVVDDHKGLAAFINKLLKKDVKSGEDWLELVSILQRGCQDNFQKHWLKIQYTVLSVSKIPELVGVDCNLFEELQAIEIPNDLGHLSNLLFGRLIEVVKKQLKNGGSTLFFNVKGISSTRSSIITSELIQARYRETILVLKEIEERIPSLTKEWVDVSRLWKTGNGYRILKARDLGIHIHVKDYKEIRNLLLKEMKADPDKLPEESMKLIEKDSRYLQFSKTLDEFVSGLIASRGIRGSFDPYYRSWINHEGLDEF
ncbi:MAG: hypothetical protein AM325_010055 [Candidatus Thorarchaeota archaeon SMTZ1-45]|nr:MAG: hypothetical protein AM325_11640 [Candidatus Thorarchaeota archaeon SMTZ1-45]